MPTLLTLAPFKPSRNPSPSALLPGLLLSTAWASPLPLRYRWGGPASHRSAWCSGSWQGLAPPRPLSATVTGAAGLRCSCSLSLGEQPRSGSFLAAAARAPGQQPRPVPTAQSPEPRDSSPSPARFYRPAPGTRGVAPQQRSGRSGPQRRPQELVEGRSASSEKSLVAQSREEGPRPQRAVWPERERARQAGEPEIQQWQMQGVAPGEE